MSLIEKRVQRAVESVLENESLLGGLDADAAQALQDWGIQHVKRIAEDTGELDDERAEEAMYPRMKASRSLMKSIRIWIEHERESSDEERTKLWAKVEQNAQALYDSSLKLPDASTFSGANTSEFVKNLISWLEKGADSGDENKGFFRSLFKR